MPEDTHELEADEHVEAEDPFDPDNVQVDEDMPKNDVDPDVVEAADA